MKISTRSIKHLAFRTAFVVLALVGGIAVVSNIDILGPEQAGSLENAGTGV